MLPNKFDGVYRAAPPPVVKQSVGTQTDQIEGVGKLVYPGVQSSVEHEVPFREWRGRDLRRGFGWDLYRGPPTTMEAGTNTEGKGHDLCVPDQKSPTKIWYEDEKRTPTLKSKKG